MNRFAAFVLDRWWIVQLYFLVSLALCIAEMVHRSFGVAAVELLAATLAYAGPAAFFNAVISRKEHHHSALTLVIHAIIGAICGAAAVWLMQWSKFHAVLFGVGLNGVLWAAVGIVVAFVAARREGEE